MPHLPIRSKLPDLPVTIFTLMTQLANRHGALNLGQGFPDFPMDPLLTELVYKAMKDGHNQYAHTFGNPELREVLCRKMKALHGTTVHADKEITITPGGTYAISNALTAILREGEEVIVFEPCFDSYIPNIRIMGAVPVCIPLTVPDFSIPWDKVEESINERTRMILINSPHNPTGTVLKESDIQALRKVVEGRNILILSDEVYEHLIFDGRIHHSILRYPDLLERSFVAFSLGKVFHCTGWKVGYAVAPDYLMKEFRNHHQFNVFSVQSAVQVAMAEYLKIEEHYLKLPDFFQARRDLFRREVTPSPLKLLPSEGSYFQCAVLPEDWKGTDREAAEFLTESIGVASIPLSAFYQDGTDHRILRFCFAKKEETLLEAGQRLQQWSGTIQN